MEDTGTEISSRSIETAGGASVPCGLELEGKHPSDPFYHLVLCLDEVWKDMQTLHFEMFCPYEGLEAL